MKVFNVCLKIAKKHSMTLLVYIVIFSSLSILLTGFSKKQTGFSGIKPNYTVINRDGASDLSKGLKKYLSGYGKEVVLEDKKSVLQDALFYHGTDYIIIIPEGFSKNYGTDREIKLKAVAVPDSANSYYMKSLVNKFLNMKKAYQSALNKNVSEEQVISTLSEETKVNLKQYGKSRLDGLVKTFYRMYAYIIIIAVLLNISTIMMVLKRPDINMRNKCSPVKLKSFNIQTALCMGLISSLTWGVLNIIGFVIFHKELSALDMRAAALILINTLVLLIVSVSIAFLAGMFIRSGNMQEAVGNFVSLSLSFLGGVFVPLELFGKGLKSAAHFVPTYWYSSALDKICELSSFGKAELLPIYQAFLIQIGFAAAIFCVALAVSKSRSESGKSFTSDITEMDM